MERRTFLKLGTAACAGALLPYHNPEYVPTEVKKPETLGLTISQKQCDLLGFPKEGFYSVLHHLVEKLDPDIIRLCLYWDEYEEESPARIDYAINYLEKIGKDFILTVGAKSPRYEEVHLPSRIKKHLGDISGKVLGEDGYFSEELMRFDDQILLKYRDCSRLTYFQDENEALDPIWLAKGAIIGEDLMVKTADLMKSRRRPGQKILTTNSISMNSPISARNKAFFNASISEAVGFNIYGKVPNRFRLGGYDSPNLVFWRDTNVLISELEESHPGLEVWCSELQAEPWEEGPNGEIIPVHLDKRSYLSSSPKQSLNLLDKVARIGIKRILAWGGEYWLLQESKGYSEWMDAYEPIFRQ